MSTIDRCSRCGRKIEGGFTSVILEYRFADPTNPPLKTLPKRLCDNCVKSFFIWSRRRVWND